MCWRHRRSALRWIATTCLAWSAALLIGCGNHPEQKTVTLHYQVEVPEAVDPERRKEILEKTVAVLRNRLPVAGTVSLAADGEIEVAFKGPLASNEDARVRKALEQYGSLQLQVAADTMYHAAVVRAAEAAEGDEVYDEQGKLIARWVPVSRALQRAGLSERTPVLTRTREGAQGDPSLLQVLLVVEPYNLSGEHVERAVVLPDAKGRPAVILTLTEEGGRRMQRLTQRYQPISAFGQPRYFHLAIIYDGRIEAAPTINAVIQRDIAIEGNFSEREMEQLVERFHAGGLPYPLKLVSETISP